MNLSRIRSGAVKNPNVLMNEGPTVIGMMSVAIEGGGSLDTAVRDVANNGPINFSKLFREVVVKADTRDASDIKGGLASMLAKLPNSLAAVRRSVHMVVAASESSSAEEKKRMLKDASEISLNGLKEVGESYSSSLNNPCMMIFGLGIMVPMILMSILPMLNLGGMFGPSPIGTGPIVILTLVVIPAIIVSMILSVKEKNPFMTMSQERKGYGCLVLLSIAPVAVVVWSITEDIAMAVMVSAVISGTVAFVAMFPDVKKEKIREKQEHLLKDAVFELGNALIAGENFETALVRSTSVRKECIPVSESVSRELSMCRGDVCTAIRMSVGQISLPIADVLCDVYRCSLKDVRDAGRLAISVGRQLQGQDIVRKVIQNKLKSMIDMMAGTAAVFAPMVLGMSVTMLGPLSKVMEGANFEGTSAILSVYLTELCVLMAVLTSYLSGRTGRGEIAYRISMMLPVSMIMFFVCSGIKI
ncbi:MAG: hypothetical protein LBV63_01330 [Candidatus Methanoplasma sp.]|jgi:hypothetical protein|nr:hypothetical protein [Candidatus Methanoplasma sp.]